MTSRHNKNLIIILLVSTVLLIFCQYTKASDEKNPQIRTMLETPFGKSSIAPWLASHINKMGEPLDMEDIFYEIHDVSGSLGFANASFTEDLESGTAKGEVFCYLEAFFLEYPELLKEWAILGYSLDNRKSLLVRSVLSLMKSAFPPIN